MACDLWLLAEFRKSDENRAKLRTSLAALLTAFRKLRDGTITPYPSCVPSALQDWSPQFDQVTNQYSGEPLTFWNAFYSKHPLKKHFTALAYGDGGLLDNVHSTFICNDLEVIFGHLKRPVSADESVFLQINLSKT